MKLLEISPCPPPHGGWEVRVAKIKAEIVRRGHQCVILNIGESRKVKSPEYEDVQSGWDYVRKVFRYCRRGYAIHMHLNGQSPKGFVLTLLSELISLVFLRRPVLTFHAGTRQTYFPRANSALCVPVLFLIFLMSRKVVCNDEAVKRPICEYGVAPRKVVPIMAFSPQYLEFEAVDLAPEVESFLESHSPVLMSYVRMRPAYHLDTTLKALERLRRELPSVGLILVGSTRKDEDMDGRAIFQLAEDLGLEDSLLWSGDVPHDMFLSILRRCEVCVRSYEFDGVCSSVLEALALGVPVVACENDLRPDGVVIFRSGDHEDLARKLKEVLGDHEAIASRLSPPELRDTLAEEVNLLLERQPCGDIRSASD